MLKKRLTPTEVLRLIEGCNLARDAFPIVLLYNTGLRIGEAFGLHHIDIDLLEKVIWVIPRENNAKVARAKSGRTRGVPVHDYVLNMYVDYLTSDEYLPAFDSGRRPKISCFTAILSNAASMTRSVRPSASKSSVGFSSAMRCSTYSCVIRTFFAAAS